MDYFQESLFPIVSSALQEAEFAQRLKMSEGMLRAWKERVARFQGGLLEPVPNPFAMLSYPLEFYRKQIGHQLADDPCIYFVIEPQTQLVLYIGETKRAEQRWLGQHDCKRYLANYVAVHHALNTQVEIHCVFWWQASADRHDRQKLEAELIHRWKSPFNKENWRLWQTPFIG
jgi:hypothetical protein